MKKLTELRQGTRVVGKALAEIKSDIHGLDYKNTIAIAECFVFRLALKLDKAIYDMNFCVGYDFKDCCEEVRENVMRGICVMGSRCSDAGLSTAGAMQLAASAPYYDFDGAIMISGGDMDSIGFRFFAPDGEFTEEDVEYLLKKADTLHPTAEYYECDDTNVMDMYTMNLRSAIKNNLDAGIKNLAGLKFVVDNSYGLGEIYGSKVLEQLGATVSFTSIDALEGTLLDAESAGTALAAQVAERGAEAGIFLTPDAGDCAVVYADGTVYTLADLAEAIADKSNPFIGDGMYMASIAIAHCNL